MKEEGTKKDIYAHPQPQREEAYTLHVGMVWGQSKESILVHGNNSHGSIT